MDAATVVELELLRELAGRLKAAGHRERGAIMLDAATRLGKSKATLYARLKATGLYDAGRKQRADAGRLSVSEEVALAAAGLIHHGTRANGKRNFKVKAAAELLHAQGLGRVDGATGEVVMPSPTTVRRAMRAYHCHPDQLAAGHAAAHIKYAHPNQVWQFDSSVAVLFYAPGGGIRGVELLDETEVYKNKPGALKRVQDDLCIRWMLTDPYSGAYFVRYFAGHEDSMGFIEFLIEAMQSRGEPLHGVPLNIVLDKGSAGRAAHARRLMKQLGITVHEHAVKNSRAKGSVEGMHNIWEQVFESRLFMWLPDSIAALNARADQVRAAHCSKATHTRHGLTSWGMWQRITADQLRLAPSVELLREQVTGKDETRLVDNQLTISFAVKGFGSRTYYVGGVPGVQIGERVTLRVNMYRAPAIDLVMCDADGTERLYTIAPAEKDAGGFFDHGVPFGEYKALPRSAAEKQLERINQAAYGVPSALEVTTARKARANAYEGTLNPFADFDAVAVPTYLPKRGIDHPMETAARELPPVATPDAVRRLKAAGDTRTDLYAQLIAEHGAEVPAAWLDAQLAALAGGTDGRKASGF